MICVSIGRGRHQHMIDEHARLVEQGAKLVELRLDYIVRTVNLKRVLKDKPGPVVVTCRREADGGKWSGTEAERQVLLRSAIAEQVDYVDLEEDIADKIPRFGKTKRIISLHDFDKTPEDLPAIHARLKQLDPDIIKIATMANNPHDNLRMLKLVQSSEIPTIGLCMGEIGTPTRILARKYGAPFTFATYSQERTMAPGQISFRQMVDIYNYPNLNKDTEVYGVIADPVGHSLSPVVHNAAFQELGLNKVYLPFRVPPEDLPQFMTDCQAMGIKGLSVTIPHKETVMAFCTKMDGAAKGVGAVNTVKFDGDDVIGYNTDYKAAMSCIDQRLPSESKKPLEGHKALILGAGGAARAIAFGLVRRGAKVFITSRTYIRAATLADDLECEAIEWEKRHSVKAEILINATPVGMHPNVDKSPFEKLKLRPNSVVFDTVYNPEQTLLFKDAKQRRCRVISGLEMFVGQAALQFYHFTGVDKPPMELIRERVKRAIGAARY
ncbi:MAG: shikimate dehydrogenase [Planctomycetota bacterium]